VQAPHATGLNLPYTPADAHQVLPGNPSWQTLFTPVRASVGVAAGQAADTFTLRLTVVMLVTETRWHLPPKPFVISARFTMSDTPTRREGKRRCMADPFHRRLSSPCWNGGAERAAEGSYAETLNMDFIGHHHRRCICAPRRADDDVRAGKDVGTAKWLCGDDNRQTYIRPFCS